MSLVSQQISCYHILRLLGSGGMGDVYLAEDQRIEQQVAIKVIRADTNPYPDAHTDQKSTSPFQLEAKAIARLDHPNILPLFGYGEECIDNAAFIYLVMPYRQEGSLASWLRQRHKGELLPPQDVAHIACQVADALQYAHNRQIIHKDMKPSNLLLRHREEIATRPDLLLADFGITRFTIASSSASQSVHGTPAYMAPEQLEGKPVFASDQYALAAIVYELLIWRTPFQGTLGRMMSQHLYKLPALPSTLNSRLSSEIDMVLSQALSKQPERRYNASRMRPLIMQ